MSKKAWSLSYTRTLILCLFSILVLLVMSMLMVSAGMRCVDRDGCIREHCASADIKEVFHAEYIIVLQDSIRNNPKCRIDIYGRALTQ
jgi:hypothetical protein